MQLSSIEPSFCLRTHLNGRQLQVSKRRFRRLAFILPKANNRFEIQTMPGNHTHECTTKRKRKKKERKRENHTPGPCSPQRRAPETFRMSENFSYTVKMTFRESDAPLDNKRLLIRPLIVFFRVHVGSDFRPAKKGSTVCSCEFSVL